MWQFPYKKLSFRLWLQISGIWTLAAVSMASQIYLNAKQGEGEAEVSFLLILLKQLPHWYLCALLTPVVLYFYERYPFDTADWKRNIWRQVGIALLVLMIFSHPRIFAFSLISEKYVWEMSGMQYLYAFLSQLAWDLAIYAFIMAVVFADKANSRRKERELAAATMELQNQELQNQLNNARLEALKLQLSPHFLFNTLNTVSSLIRTGEYSTAIQVNARLGTFLRATLNAGDSQMVSLEKELEFLDLYLAIESLRFSDRLRVEKNIQQECLKTKVPYLILQPVIENAIKHGITRQSNAKRILIQALHEKNCLMICIFNEGKLLPEDWVPHDHWNIGLQNVHKRLQGIYGNAFIFRIENHPEGRGVQAFFNIPDKVLT